MKQISASTIFFCCLSIPFSASFVIPQLVKCFWNMLLVCSINNLKYDETAIQYPLFVSHAQSIGERKTLWARVYRQKFPLRGQNTNNFVEAAMRILKDKFFEKTRAFNIVQMVDFLIVRFSCYYERKLLDASHNRLNCLFMLLKFPPHQSEEVTKLSESVYIVGSSTGKKTYEVDTLACSCTCTLGFNGKACKHQFWVVQSEFVVEMCTMNTPTCRKLWYLLATGRLPLTKWLACLHDEQPSRPIAEVREVTTRIQLPNSSPVGADMDVENSPSDDSKSIESLLSSIQVQFISVVSDAALKEPRQFVHPLEIFLDTLSNLRTPNAIVSALQTFGKYVGGGEVCREAN